MNLLREIQEAAVDGASDLETLLRKCRVLATRLKHEELKKWVACELDGYPEDALMPDYRECHGQAYGHFFGAYGRRLENWPIPMSEIPDQYRDHMSQKCLHEGVGELKNLLETVNGVTIQFVWPAEVSQIVRPSNLAKDFVLGQGWLSINKSQIAGILSTVRNRILGFALELESSFPDTGEAVPGDTPLPKEEVNRVFHQEITQNFHAPVANVANGHTIEQTGTVNVLQGDFQSLTGFLEENGVSKEDILELKSAIKADPRPQPSSKRFGTKVATWLGKMVTKSAKGAWKVGTEVAAKLLTDAINAHYGMHP